MPKQNTALLLSRYIWLIDTINSARKHSLLLNTTMTRASGGTK